MTSPSATIKMEILYVPDVTHNLYFIAKDKFKLLIRHVQK